MSTTPPAWASLRLLPRAVWWLAGANFVNRMGAMVFPFLVLYFNRRLHLSLETGAAIAAYYGVGSAVAAPTGGWLSDRFDAVKVFAFSLLSAGTLMAVFPWIDGYTRLAVATFFIALLTDISRPAALTALARLGGSEQSREAFNLNYMAINLGMSVGPLLGAIWPSTTTAFYFGATVSARLPRASCCWLRALAARCTRRTTTSPAGTWASPPFWPFSGPRWLSGPL